MSKVPGYFRLDLRGCCMAPHPFQSVNAWTVSRSSWVTLAQVQRKIFWSYTSYIILDLDFRTSYYAFVRGFSILLSHQSSSRFFCITLHPFVPNGLTRLKSFLYIQSHSSDALIHVSIPLVRVFWQILWTLNLGIRLEGDQVIFDDGCNATRGQQ